MCAQTATYGRCGVLATIEPNLWWHHIMGLHWYYNRGQIGPFTRAYVRQWEGVWDRGWFGGQSQRGSSSSGSYSESLTPQRSSSSCLDCGSALGRRMGVPGERGHPELSHRIASPTFATPLHCERTGRPDKEGQPAPQDKPVLGIGLSSEGGTSCPTSLTSLTISRL